MAPTVDELLVADAPAAWSTVLEVVQEPPEAIERAGGDHPAFFWGLALVAPDLDETVAVLGKRVSEIRPAVQPGRRIATCGARPGSPCRLR